MRVERLQQELLVVRDQFFLDAQSSLATTTERDSESLNFYLLFDVELFQSSSDLLLIIENELG